MMRGAAWMLVLTVLLSATEVVWKRASHVDEATLQRARLEYLKQTDPKRYAVYKRHLVVSGTLIEDQPRNDHGTHIEPAMLFIEPGSFQMGSNDGGSDEKPVHTVHIKKGFYLGRTEVTFAEYDKYCEATGKSKPKDQGWGRGNRPVIYVSWNDATDYAKWLSQKTGKRYRLPSEAEWEYAARAGTTTKYSWGNSIDCSKARYGYYADQCGNQKSTDPVGTFAANPWGVYDMHGNVWEWCADWYTDSYSTTPRDGSENKNKDQNKKVLRGGSWNGGPSRLRSAVRGRGTPSYRDDNIGFRLARD